MTALRQLLFILLTDSLTGELYEQVEFQP